jgi:hypothetical protein
LFIALSDLLPEVQFHRHDRLKLFAALLAGVALMGMIALLEPHSQGGGGGEDGGKPVTPAAPAQAPAETHTGSAILAGRGGATIRTRPGAEPMRT